MPVITINFDDETWTRYLIALRPPASYTPQERRQFGVNEVRRMVKRRALLTEMDDFKLQRRDALQTEFRTEEARRRQELDFDGVVDPPVPPPEPGPGGTPSE